MAEDEDTGAPAGAMEHHGIIDELQPLAVPVALVKTLEGNPRRGDVEAVARSLERFGQRKPIVIHKDDGRTLAGNHTLMAARSLGWTHIAAVRVEDDPTEAKAFAIADNRTHDLGGYDRDALLEMITDVQELGTEDLVEAMGYDADALEELFAGLPEDPDWAEMFGNAPEGGDPLIMTMTFTVHVDHVPQIREAVAAARLAVPDEVSAVNANHNGQALVVLAREYLQR